MPLWRTVSGVVDAQQPPSDQAFAAEVFKAAGFRAEPFESQLEGERHETRDGCDSTVPRKKRRTSSRMQ